MGRCVIPGAAMLVLLPGLAWAQPARPQAQTAPPPLVSHDALQQRLSEPGLRLLDARPRAEYEKGHIPGAVRVDVKAAEALAARPDGLADRMAWEAWAAPLGLSPDAQVLVYDGKRQLDAARVWWLLRYLGLDRVGLVDGNFPLWQAAGRPVSTEIPAIAPRPLKVRFRADRLATRDEVRRAIEQGGSRIIDARSEAEYAGQEKRSRRAGHIPGACLIEWSGLVDQDGRFLAPEALRTRLAGQGIRPEEPTITHCQGGGRASVDAFALERLGIPTRNYYLGWSDWGNSEDTPVEGKK
jgi:thiosulfate/3-mercaptopyruvate sulfurtransferase